MSFLPISYKQNMARGFQEGSSVITGTAGLWLWEQGQNSFLLPSLPASLNNIYNTLKPFQTLKQRYKV